ncbi:6-phosphogluconolactonase [Euzebya tangerina]|uniref:6-phosphogluconolactonase n=1 Tax=Euzebya tangerina TaxID=591198 RepID=UPI000E3202CE|nr:6-phosphogluconolactonase [Euzebya tangerina]
MSLERQVEAQPDGVTRACADLIADRLGRALVARGTATLALSGGSTPKPLYRMLATYDLQWRAVHVVQVDERVAPADHPDRNWVAIEEGLVGVTGAVGHPMPTTREGAAAGSAGDWDVLVASYADELRQLGRLDVVHLGLGDDGHTASLVPGDPVLDLTGSDAPSVAMTEPYQGRRRMTLTAPTINAAATIVWQVVGGGKAHAVAQLLAEDPSIPGSLIRQARDVHLVMDEAAGGRS